MRVLNKINLLVMSAVFMISLFLIQPMMASAAEKVPGGKGNTAVVQAHSYYKSSNNNYEVVQSITIKAKEDYEIIGYYEMSTGTLYFYVVVGNTYKSLGSEYLDDVSGVDLTYKNGELESSRAYTKSDLPLYFQVSNRESSGVTASFTYKNIKLFPSYSYMLNYAQYGSLDGMLEFSDDVDTGIYDPNIGYLHNLKTQYLTYGGVDEDGFNISNEERFTWSDYYPEYDESYLVEVRASCEVEVKKWFGIGNSLDYKSNIRVVDTGVTYKDLEYILSLEHGKEVFSDFINEYMPTNSFTVGSYWLDTYYFRIYRYDEGDSTFHYGKWVRLQKYGSALNPSDGYIVDEGDLDNDGNFKPDPDSDYGDGEEGKRVVGGGDNQDDAKDDADKKQDEQENGRKPIDFSNTNFEELWDWFLGVLVSFWEGIGVIPDFFARLFSFLPSPVIALIAGSIVIAFVLRILGR